jgi:hypothetical protein
VAVTLVQSAHSPTGSTVTLGASPTPGNTLLAWITNRSVAAGMPPGFTSIASVSNATGFTRYGRMAYRVVESGDGTAWVSSETNDRVTLMEWAGDYAGVASSQNTVAASTTMDAGGSVGPSAGDEVVIVGGAAIANSDGGIGSVAITPDAGVTELTETNHNNGSEAPVHWLGYRQVPSSAGFYSVGGTNAASEAYCGVTVVIVGDAADPDVDPPPEYEAPEPGQAIVEIYVDDPDGYRWDVAQWDEATWAEAAWVSITEWCIFADVTWGADRPDAGILADQVAGNWVIETHDPDRVLDPANDESPFYPHLVPELPIRINHNSRTVRTGQVSIITYSHEREGGRISASDAVSRTSRADVPPGTALGDTFLERVADAINGAGIDLWVAFPAGELMDRPLASADIDARRSVWQRISEAARELLAVPWVDRDGHIRVTEWDEDTDRGLVIGSGQMVDLTPWVSHDGLYSVVRALDSDEVTIAEAAAAPLPPYGERVYERTEPTIDAVDWVTRVLADRQGAVLRYRPGTIRAWTAAQNDALVDMELMDIITLSYPETDPPIEVRARVLGARVRVTDRTKRYPAVLTRWEWTLLTTLVPSVPLIADGEADLTYLVSDEDGTTYLYPG